MLIANLLISNFGKQQPVYYLLAYIELALCKLTTVGIIRQSSRLHSIIKNEYIFFKNHTYVKYYIDTVTHIYINKYYINENYNL